MIEAVRNTSLYHNLFILDETKSNLFQIPSPLTRRYEKDLRHFFDRLKSVLLRN